MTDIALDDIQGDILRAYGNSYVCTTYLFLQVIDAGAAKAWLGRLAEQVTNAEDWGGNKPNGHVNVAFTAAGLTELGVDHLDQKNFAEEFLEGMATRAPRLGDVGKHGPDHWEEGLGTGVAHVLVILNAQSHEEAERRQDALLTADDGLEVVHEDHAEVLKDVREHFGFADGLAQPAIAGVSDAKARGGGTPEKNGAWRPLAIGEFIFGYDDEASLPYPKEEKPAPPGDLLGLHGTYMVWRKLAQHVALFRTTLRDAGYPGGEELLAAKVVGRWRTGAALTLSPDNDTGGFVTDADGKRSPSNDFRYHQDDVHGDVCPLGAHIRRSNPRDALGDEGLLSFRHRMIRRGMPYGPRLPDGQPEDDVERGLIFVCYVASISRQFEGVQTQWMEDGNVFGLAHDKDFLQRGTGTMTVQGTPPFLLGPQQDFVTLRGGEYLFVPGIAGLRLLADLG